VSLYDDLLERMNGTEYSDYFSALCPFHDDHNPSLMVYQDNFRCLACGKHGSLQFLARKVGHFTGVSYTTKHTVLPRWHTWEDKYGTIQQIAERAHKGLEWFPQHKAFFKRRKIDQFINEGMFGYLDGWVLFPVMSPTGKVIDIVVRDAGNKRNAPRYVLHPDDQRESPYLYVPRWHSVFGAETVYVPFGMIDAWAFESIGLAAVTGTSGKSLSVDKLKELQELTDCRFVFVPDKDEEREAYRLANKLGWRADVLLLHYPEGCKDPDDIRTKVGRDMLSQMATQSHIIGFSVNYVQSKK